MNILPLGDCNHPQAEEGEHVKKRAINELEKNLRAVQNMTDTDPTKKGAKIRQLLLIKRDIEQFVSIVKNDPARHNNAKLPKLERLSKKADNALEKTTTGHPSTETASRRSDRGAQSNASLSVTDSTEDITVYPSMPC